MSVKREGAVRSVDVDLAWRVMNGVNGILPPLADEEKKSLLERFLDDDQHEARWAQNYSFWSADKSGIDFTHFAHFLPHNEKFIPGTGLWLRMLGVLDCDHRKAEKWKYEIWNMILIQDDIGKPMEPHCRGTIILPTLKEAKKIVEVAEKRLAGLAEPECTEDFGHFNSSRLMDDWGRTVDSYKVVDQKKKLVGPTKIKYFECTMMIVHNEYRKSSDEASRNIVNIRRVLLHDLSRHAPNGDPSQAIDDEEEWSWKMGLDHQRRREMILPRPVHLTQYRRREFEDEGRVVTMNDVLQPEGEPKMMIPFDPVSAIVVFKGVIQELEKEEWKLTAELQKLIQILEWFLVLAEVDSTLSMWEKRNDRPDEFLDTPIPACPINARKVVRQSQFDFGVYSDSLKLAYKKSPEGDGKGKGKRPESPLPYKGADNDTHFQQPHDDTPPDSDQGSSGHRQYPDDSGCDSRFDSWGSPLDKELKHKPGRDGGNASDYMELECKHKRCKHALKVIDARATVVLAYEAEIVKGWIQKDGLSKAANKLRHDPPSKVFLKPLEERYNKIEELMVYCQNDCEAKAEKRQLFEDNL